MRKNKIGRGFLIKMKTALSFLLAALLVLGLAGCGRDAGEGDSSLAQEPQELEYPVSIGDQTIAQAPQSVVSLSAALTELCYDMGYGDRLVGVSDYCDWPEQAQALDQMGTAQQPDLDAIRAAGPDAVITHTALAEDDLIALQQADIPVVVLSRARLPEDLKDLYVNLGRLMEGEQAGSEAGKSFYNEQMGRVESIRETVDAYVRGGGKQLSAVYLRMLDFTVATGDTFEGAMLEAIGLENEAGAYGNWTYPLDFLDQYDPDVIFCNTDITIPMLEQNDNYKGLSATIQDLVYSYDFTAFERQGKRMFDILEDMAQKAYPEAFAGAAQSGSSSAAE